MQHFANVCAADHSRVFIYNWINYNYLQQKQIVIFANSINLQGRWLGLFRDKDHRNLGITDCWSILVNQRDNL